MWAAASSKCGPGPQRNAARVGMWALQAARDLLAGADPYARPYHALAVPYPLPAVFIGLPLAWLSDRAAAGVFIDLSSALLAYVSTARAWWPLLVFVSAPYVAAMRIVQWSPLILAAPSLPALGLALLPLLRRWRDQRVATLLLAAVLPCRQLYDALILWACLPTARAGALWVVSSWGVLLMPTVPGLVLWAYLPAALGLLLSSASAGETAPSGRAALETSQATQEGQ